MRCAGLQASSGTWLRVAPSRRWCRSRRSTSSRPAPVTAIVSRYHRQPELAAVERRAGPPAVRGVRRGAGVLVGVRSRRARRGRRTTWSGRSRPAACKPGPGTGRAGRPPAPGPGSSTAPRRRPRGLPGRSPSEGRAPEPPARPPRARVPRGRRRPACRSRPVAIRARGSGRDGPGAGAVSHRSPRSSRTWKRPSCAATATALRPSRLEHGPDRHGRGRHDERGPRAPGRR